MHQEQNLYEDAQSRGETHIESNHLFKADINMDWACSETAYTIAKQHNEKQKLGIWVDDNEIRGGRGI